MSKIKLSNSQASRYMRCPQSWDYHYNKKIRPTTTSAALLLGTAIDRALDAVLLPDESKKKPKDLFQFFWRFQDINGKREYLPKSHLITYANSDFDAELLLPEDIAKYEAEFEEKLTDDVMDYLKNKKKELGYEKMERKDIIRWNFLNWSVARHKGMLMIDAIEREFKPKVTKVHSTQEQIKLINDDGDEIRGAIDLVANIEGYEQPIILDLKTAARPYDEDSVLTSPQLSLYVAATKHKYKTNLAGYVVLSKQIAKNKVKICTKCGNDGSGGRHATCDANVEGARCKGEWTITLRPKANVQIIIDKIPEQTLDLVLDNYNYVNSAIKSGTVYKNLASCTDTFGGNCEYFNLCYRGSMNNLVDKSEDKE